jgi:hypothetical protein
LLQAAFAEPAGPFLLDAGDDLQRRLDFFPAAVGQTDECDTPVGPAT